MMNYTETLTKIQELKKELRQIKESTDFYNYRKKLQELYTKKDIKAIEKTKEKYTNDCIIEQEKIMLLKAYSYNAEKLLKLENIQKIIDILNSYSGKKYGEKTKEKIREEIKNIIGYYVYITNDSIAIYCDDFDVYNRQITIYTKTDINDKEKYKIISGENKINTLNIDMFVLPESSTLINDVENFTKIKLEEFAELKTMYIQMEEKIKEYNKINPFNYLNIREGIRDIV